MAATPTHSAEDLLRATPLRWLVTGAAGFIGSHLVEFLLANGHHVVALDDFSTGSQENLDDVAKRVGAAAWGRFRLARGDVRKPGDCREAMSGVDLVLHQAALGSIPRSIADPVTTHEVNATGTLNVLLAARDLEVRRVVYASSSSVYGDDRGLPKVESRTGRPLSPYAVGKAMGEGYARVFADCYAMETVGLRYFNVFGPRQSPNGAYAAVIPRWFGALVAGKRGELYGDPEKSRDFCFVRNVVEANVLAALAPKDAVTGRIFNIAVGQRTTLKSLYEMIQEAVGKLDPRARDLAYLPGPARKGDIEHSQADVSAARAAFGYEPRFTVSQGLESTAAWYLEALGAGGAARERGER
jgi:UDP-N-acetylglucosamine 4-epimerase